MPIIIYINRTSGTLNAAITNLTTKQHKYESQCKYIIDITNAPVFQDTMVGCVFSGMFYDLCAKLDVILRM